MNGSSEEMQLNFDSFRATRLALRRQLQASEVPLSSHLEADGADAAVQH